VLASFSIVISHGFSLSKIVCLSTIVYQESLGIVCDFYEIWYIALYGEYFGPLAAEISKMVYQKMDLPAVCADCGFVSQHSMKFCVMC